MERVGDLLKPKDATAAPKKVRRDRTKELMLAQARQAIRLGDVAVAQREGTLGDEYIKLAQAMILCTLPYSATTETKITRQARLGDGTTLYVTFSAALPNVPMPFGADRKLLAWIFDRALRSDSPFIPWESAVEYQREVGMGTGGKNYRALKARFSRVAGLVINIQREAGEGKRDLIYPVIEQSYLPTSITGTTRDAEQPSLPEFADRFGFAMNQSLFNDIRRHHIVLPRQLWRDIKGPTVVQDMMLWLTFRCYSAASETVIPWSALNDQFPPDKNPDRPRANARKAIKLLREVWPGVRVEALDHGILVNQATEPLLEDDPSRRRTRRLPSKV